MNRFGVCRQLVFAIVSVALASLSGCAYLGNWKHNGLKVGPDYCRPVADVSHEWIDFNDPRVISEECGVDESTWWQNFNDSVLDDLVLTASQHNLPLRAAGLRVLEARAQRAIAAGNLFPQVQEAFGNFEQRQRSLEGYSASLPDGTRSLGVFTTGFNASWEWDLWGRIRRGIASADANLEASIKDYDDILITLIADTATTYIELRSFQQRIRYARANVATQEKSLQLAEDRHGNGLASKLDVTEAQASLHQTKSLIPVLETGLRMANNRLCVLLGSPTRNMIEELGDTGDETIPTPPEQAVVGIPTDLIRRRPDIRREERKLAAQSELIGVAAADLFPTFTINGSINWQSTDFGNLFAPATTAGFIRPGLNWNILNYGRIENNVAVQDVRFKQLVISYLHTVLDANREVEDAIVEFLRAHERSDELQKTVEAATESVSLAQIQYNQGQIDFDRVNNLQRNLVIQQDRSVTAEANVAIGLIHIYRALGGGWQLRCHSQ